MSGRYPEFEGAVVFVTGAAAGIGRAIVRAFLAEGASVTALDRNAMGLEETLAGHGRGRALPLVCDITDPDALDEAYRRAGAQLGFPKVLVNNAGRDDRRPFEEIGAEEWRAALAVNLDHHFLLARLAAPAMRTNGGGAIVNISSTAFMKLAPNLASYHAAKAGIVGLTRGLARELGPDLVRVNAVAPGRVMTERVRDNLLTPEWEAETKALQCLPVLIEPADIAAAVLWLASDGARTVTGQTIIVDGGVV
ncbi:SDR family NAD(P)-dependent oxidoreductase [Chelativorans xinjiangense]|uniref:SDR family NAD(P)-dependent oxidoreductase n=1 Tax=Chelativorans xinjiangense TaxID=2681485 RepID=UPI0013583530|nr:SDR family oxidoreductase [Chelativorans xinjiangense]